MYNIGKNIRPKVLRCVRLEKKSMCHFKEMLLFSLNYPILLGCVDKRGLMMDTLGFIESFQKNSGPLSDLIIFMVLLN